MEKKKRKYLFTSEERAAYIAELTPELAMLRTKAEISQEELASLLGVTRQTYNAIECKSRKMSWSTYLALIFFYDHNRKTHQMLRTMDIFPFDLVKFFNGGLDNLEFEMSDVLGNNSAKIVDTLDEQAMRAIKFVIIAEYARCADLSTEAAVKSFAGVDFTRKTKSQEKAKQK